MDLKFKDGLIPVIIQEHDTGEVLMLGYMNAEALRRTVENGSVTFFSRSRQELWTKGETSGHKLELREIRVDCDEDALLIRVNLKGPGCCHEGYRSCFFRRITAGGEEIAAERAFDPAPVYGSTAR